MPREGSGLQGFARLAGLGDEETRASRLARPMAPCLLYVPTDACTVTVSGRKALLRDRGLTGRYKSTGTDGCGADELLLGSNVPTKISFRPLNKVAVQQDTLWMKLHVCSQFIIVYLLTYLKYLCTPEVCIDSLLHPA